MVGGGIWWFGGMVRYGMGWCSMVWCAVVKVLRIRPERKFCKLGDLSDQNGWAHAKLLERLESRRKVRAKK